MNENTISEFSSQTGAVKTARKVGGISPAAIQQAVGGWLDDHPEATTTVLDGAISSKKLDAQLQDAVGITSIEGELFAESDWVDGYLGTANVNNTSNNTERRTKRAARVYAGETVRFKLAHPMIDGNAYTYLAYCFVAGEDDLRYVSERYSVDNHAKCNTQDENYKYYEGQITIESDGWLICAYRINGLQHSASSISGLVESNRLEQLTETVTNQATAISNLRDDNDELRQYRFPDDQTLPIVSAHRCMARVALPENTMPALAACSEDGWPWVEIDARLTSDGVWVCLHDASINRTARNADGTAIPSAINIEDISYRDALNYDFGIYAGAYYAGTPIMRLEDCLHYCRLSHICLQIDIKSGSWTPEQMATMWALVTKYRMERRVMLVASSIGNLDDLLALDPYVPVAITAGSWTQVTPENYASTVPYANGARTGKNKVYVETKAESFSNKAAMDNFVEYFRSWGIYPGVYGPISKEDIMACSDLLDICCGQFIRYDDAKAAEMMN